jgi:hypothetical protein
MEMKTMDDEIVNEIKRGVREERKIEMSAVVPVTGLIMARSLSLSLSLSPSLPLSLPLPPSFQFS